MLSFACRVTGLSNVLHEIEEALSQQVLTDWQTKALKSLLEECHNILLELGKLIDEDYLLKPSNTHGFRDKSRRAWKRLTWEPDDIEELRSRVALNVGFLNTFNISLIRCLPKIPDKYYYKRVNIYQQGNLGDKAGCREVAQASGHSRAS